MREEQIRRFCSLMRVDIVSESYEGVLSAYFHSTNDSPLMQSESLRQTLKEGADSKPGSYLLKGNYNCWFSSVKTASAYVYIGPMCAEKLSSLKKKQMLRSYGASEEEGRQLPLFTLPEIRDIVLFVNSMVNEPDENDRILLSLDGLGNVVLSEEKQIRYEQTRGIIREEEEDEDNAYRHSYQEEQLLMQAVREGRAEDAVRLAENMDPDAGRLSGSYLRHRRNLAIIGIALIARAAIDGGMSPPEAYRISGYYIEKCDASRDTESMLYFRNQAIREMVGKVAEKLAKPRTSSYVEKAQYYINKHYREKIYLETVAENLGISESYLSRMFKKEAGTSFQDYINEVRVERAANLLLYSELSLAEIAEYVNFPNQSYFGKMFKRYKNMTPRAFKEQFRNTEAFG